MEDAREWLRERDQVDDLALFLDFDGTLAPIVERPGDARPLDGIPALVEAVTKRVPVAVISGRDVDDVRARLGVEGIWYAGSHGMDLVDPQGRREVDEELERLIPMLDEQEDWLRERFSEAPRVEIERKRFGIAVHFRRRPEAQEIVEKALQDAVDQAEGLKKGVGKMVRELQPDVDVDKGTALLAIRRRTDPDSRFTPVYIGDDTTDEDAFEVIRNDGVGILVADQPRETAALYRLEAPAQVREFLEVLVERLEVGS